MTGMLDRRWMLVVAILASGCAAPKAAGPEASARVTTELPDVATPEASAPVATLGPGDVFEVRVYDEAELSGLFRVASDGTIDYPLCGVLFVRGHTPAGAGDAIQDCLADGFLKNPQVTVFVRENNSARVYVFGEVQKAGTLPYDQGMSVVEAITRAGGFTRTAATNTVIVTRRIEGRERRLKVPVADIGVGRSPNLLLMPGDIVFVPESFF